MKIDQTEAHDFRVCTLLEVHLHIIGRPHGDRFQNVSSDLSKSLTIPRVKVFGKSGKPHVKERRSVTIDCWRMKGIWGHVIRPSDSRSSLRVDSASPQISSR